MTKLLRIATSVEFLLFVSLQRSPSIFKEHSIFKSFGYVSSLPPLEGWIAPYCPGQVVISGTAATSPPGSRSPLNGTINGWSEARLAAKASDQPNQRMRWNPSAHDLSPPHCTPRVAYFPPSLPTINLSICRGESSCLEDLLSHPLVKVFHWQRNTFSCCCIFTVWRFLVRTIWGYTSYLCWFQMSGEDAWLITHIYCHKL